MIILDVLLFPYRRLFPKANFSYVPNAGHWVHADNPDAFLSTLLAFLGPDKSR